MGYVAIADRDHEIEHHDPQTFISKYVWSQDHKANLATTQKDASNAKT